MPEIKLERIERRIVEVDIIGVSPLIPHKWSEKAKRLMREAQSGTAVKAKREPKSAAEEGEAALYRLPDGTPGMPATAFKAAVIGAVRMFQGITLVQTKSALFVLGEGPEQLVRIEGEMELREDMPRNANGNADLRYRYAFWPWRATLQVQYLATLIDESSAVALVDAAGDGGVGDWRPSAPKSHTGMFGRFRVEAL
jgi:hypothetical protein